jgi:hypothetical protein
MEVWNKVKLGARVRWKGTNGVMYDATVVKFTSPTSYIRVRGDDGREVEIYIESIKEVIEDT